MEPRDCLSRCLLGRGWLAVCLVAVLGTQTFAADKAGGTEMAPAPTEVAPTGVAAPFTLNDCLRLAMENHPTLAVGRAQIAQSAGEAYQAGLCPNPKYDPGGPQVIGPERQNVYVNGFTQEIVTAGKLRLDRAAANVGVRQSRFDFVRRRYELMTNVRQDFFDALAGQQRLVVNMRLYRLNRQSELNAEKLLQAGQGTEADVLLLRTERRRAESAYRANRLKLAGQYQQLAASMGRPDLRLTHIDGDLDIEVPNFDDPNVLISALEQSAVVQTAQLDITRTMYLLRRAQVAAVPNVTIQGGHQYNQGGAPFNQALVGVYFDVPLWNRNQGGISAAEAAIRKAKAQRQAVELDLIHQLADALGRFRAATTTVQNYRDGILPDVQRNVEIVQKAYAQGQFDISRLLQAQRQAAETNVALIDAQGERLSAAAEIAGLLQLDDFPCPGKLAPAPDDGDPLPSPPSPVEPLKVDDRGAPLPKPPE